MSSCNHGMRGTWTLGSDDPPAAMFHDPDVWAAATARSEREVCNERRVWHLAASFAQQPELIRTCLSNLPATSTAWVRLILRAARLALEVHPDNAELCYLAGQAAVCAGDYDTATALLERSLAQDPQAIQTLLLAARVAVARGENESARTHLEAALKRGADPTEIQMLLGDLQREDEEANTAGGLCPGAPEDNSILTSAGAGLLVTPMSEVDGSNHELSA